MTSRRDGLDRHSTGGLDDLLRWALHERVAGSGPAPHVWERIEQRVGRPTVWDLMGLGFSWSYRAVIAWLSRMDLFVGVQVVAWPWPENRWEWRRDPRSTRFLDQYTFLLQLAF